MEYILEYSVYETLIWVLGSDYSDFSCDFEGVIAALVVCAAHSVSVMPV